MCYRCEKTGHFARECPEGRHGGGPHPGSSAVCYRCDRTGHFARDCPEQELEREADKENSRRQQDSRDRVPGAGVRERKDPRERDYAYGEGGGLRCYRTGRWGVFGSAARPHLDQEPGDRERCYRCSATGHIARYRASLSVRLHHIPYPYQPSSMFRNCTQDGDQPVCYNCNKIGHILKDCPNAGTKTCYKCGGIGHILKDCPSRV